MNRRVLLLAVALLAAGGCKMFDSGSKADANAVTRRYDRPAPEVWNAMTAALQSLELKIDDDHHDALGGDLTASRATGDSVKVGVKSLDELSSQVTVSVGQGDRNMAEIVHSRVARNLGTGAAKSSFYGGNRWDQTVNSSLARCILAGERACTALGYTITSRDLRENTGELIANKTPSSQVLMHFEDAAPQANPPAASGLPSDRAGQVRVSFVVGTMRTDENEQIVQRLRTEFEGFLR